MQDNLTISSVLKRGNYRDTLVTVKGKEIDFSREIIIGTGSNRRKLAFKNLYPNATFKDIRGNVDTDLINFIMVNMTVLSLQWLVLKD